MPIPMNPVTDDSRAGGRALKALSVAALSMAAAILFLTGTSEAKARKGEVSFVVTVDAPEASKDVRLWVPYPVSDAHQTISDVRVGGNYTRSGVYREETTGNLILYAEWTAPSKDRRLTLAFNAEAEERVMRDAPRVNTDFPIEMKPYLQATKFMPTDGKVREIALKVTEGKKDVKEKARAVYDWVVENTFRDPNVQGCGTGDVEVMLSKRGGKCADISSVFVAISRAAGVPAREVFGLRLGKSPEEDITGGYHCWAEFYVPTYGWVPVDPADVRKVMLTKGLDLEGAREYREYYFGAVDEYRVALGSGGRDYYLSPRQNDGPINYFMYPYAEVDGKALEWLAAQKELKYKVTFRELK